VFFFFWFLGWAVVVFLDVVFDIGEFLWSSIFALVF